MGSHLEHALTTLAKDAILRIDAGAGQAVVVVHGRVWITQEDDPRDVVLGRGDSFAPDRPGMALAQALRDSSLLVVARHDAGGGDPLPAAPFARRARQAERGHAGGQVLADGARRLVALPDLLRKRWTLGRPEARGTAEFD